MLKVSLAILAIPFLVAFALAWVIVISKRAQRAWASANQADLRGMHLNMLCPVADNAGQGPLSGEPLVFGRGTSPSFGLCGVSETNYTPPTGVPTGFCTINCEGVFNLTVVGKSSIGGGGLAFAIGDQVYADGGTYDPVTGCLYGFTLNGNNSAGVKFGVVLDTVASGVTQVTRVRLKQSS
jgi:hypothetical protein